MLLIEIIKTCSHEKVAQAAIVSIGTEFQQRIEKAARERGLRTGIFVALAVRCFGRTAGGDQWAGLANAMEGKDMPILAGLRHIMEVTLADQIPVPARVRGGARAGIAAPAPTIGFGCEA